MLHTIVIDQVLTGHHLSNTVEPRFSERQPSGNPRISGNAKKF